MSINGVKGVADTADQYVLNKMNSHANAAQLGDKIFSQKVSLLGKYDYSLQGGAVGNIALLDSKGSDLKVPENFVVTNVIIDRVTDPSATSADADFLLSMNAATAGDLLGATDETAFDGAGSLLAGTPVGTAATSVRATAERTIYFNVKTSAITSGKFYVQLEGYLSRAF